MVQFHVNNVQDQLDYRHLCVRSSSCMEGVWLDGQLDGRVTTDNDYGGFEVSEHHLHHCHCHHLHDHHLLL